MHMLLHDGNYRKADKVIQDMRSAGLTLNQNWRYGEKREIIVEYRSSAYALSKTSDGDVLECNKKEIFILNCDRVEEGFDDSSEKILHSSSRFCGVEKVDIDGNLEAHEDDVARELKSVEEKKSIFIIKDKFVHMCVEEEEATPDHGVLTPLKNWLKLLSDGSLPSINVCAAILRIFFDLPISLDQFGQREQLKKNDHGKDIMFLSKPDEMTRSNQKIAQDLHAILFAESGKLVEAKIVFDEMRRKEVKNVKCMETALDGKFLYILLSGGLLKDAYLVVKDNVELIPKPAIKKFAISFMRNGNINLVNDVIKSIHNSNYKIDQDIFHLAISRYIEQPEKKDLLLHLLQWMPAWPRFDLDFISILLKQLKREVSKGSNKCRGAAYLQLSQFTHNSLLEIVQSFLPVDSVDGSIMVQSSCSRSLKNATRKVTVWHDNKLMEISFMNADE
ncbi:hypothetical protein SASPL_145353 [Salvia splendens]|uniref:Pentatricopeptide repeat-containing protein n=1 Tax=Salvia splendens TaxID=180675 RepID=A0A8X8WGW7_SALSN|nr:hypothetical protein SASPL_145353 [Salvia splendens]